MNNATPELLECFDSAVREHLYPFMETMSATHSVGHSNFDGWPGPSSISKRNYQELAGSFFWWINRFEIGDCTLDIGYGDKEFLLEPLLYYKGIEDQFAPWELLAAANIPNPHSVSGAAWVLTPDFMRRSIKSMSAALISHWSLLASPTPDLIDRSLLMRGQRMVFAQQEQRRHDRERASMQASSSFHNGNYKEAIQLLEPYRDDVDLPRSTAMFLRIAQQKMK